MSDINEMNDGLRWYVAHTYSGYENKVKTNLEKIVENRGLGDVIQDVVVPVETVIETDGDTTKEVESKIFPSYVLIKMVMTDATWHVVRNITGVTGFVGPGSRPTPLTEEEVMALAVEKHAAQSITVGDRVEIVDSPFAGFTGVVSEISPDGAEITVLVKTAQRDMPIKLEAKNVKRKAD